MAASKRKLVKDTTFSFKLSKRWKRHMKNKAPDGIITDLIMEAVAEKIGEPPLTPTQDKARNTLE